MAFDEEDLELEESENDDPTAGRESRFREAAERGFGAHNLRIPRRIFANGSVAARPRLSFGCRTLRLASTG